MPENLQIILRFSLIFSDFLRFSLNFSVFLRIFAPENPLPVKKRLRCYNLYKSIKKR